MNFFLGDRLVRHGAARTAPRLGQRLRFRFVLLILQKRLVSVVRDVLCPRGARATRPTILPTVRSMLPSTQTTNAAIVSGSAA